MRDKGIPLQRIGEYFNRDHATIIHGLNMEECFRNDKQYLKDTKEYDNLFQIHQ
jgi:chromosomal replication initiation ATPase DnaA